MPRQDAWAVRALREAGAVLVGKTHLHELAYGITGINPHYGTPKNPRVPGGIPGGSSSGSAVAVAAGLVDFALGTDTGGSIRAPASFCGIYGYRPTHGHIPEDGVVPLASSFDTVGVFARTPGVLRRVAEVLLRPPVPSGTRALKRAWIAQDALERVEPEAAAAVRRVADALEARGIEVREVTLDALEAIHAAQSALQGAEAWAVHQAWLEARRPRLGPDVARLLEIGRQRSAAELGRASAERARLTHALDRLVGEAAVLLLPAAPGVAPQVAALEDPEVARAFRARILPLMNPASLAGLPVVVVPAAPEGAPPVGVQLVGPRGSDRALLALAERLWG